MADVVPLYADRTRAEVFGSIAAHYERYRPSYPKALIDDLVALGPRTVLDVGCGTGKAGTLLTARGLDVLGVEIDPNMAEVARSHGLTVEISSFEGWADEGRTFDLLVSGQAWHWVDPALAVPKAAQVLRPGGHAAVFWNHDRIADPAVDQARDQAYRELVPELVDDEPERTGERPEFAPFAESPGFAEVVSRNYQWQRRMAAEDWVAMCFTYSNHVLLPAERRKRFAQRLLEIGEAAGGVVIDYEVYLILARRAAS